MLFSKLITVAAFIAGVSARVEFRSNGPNSLKNTYLFELADHDVDAESHVVSYLKSVGLNNVTVRQKLHHKIQRKGRKNGTGQVLAARDDDISFNGVSLTINEADFDKELVKNTPGVVNIFRVFRVPGPKPMAVAGDGVGKFSPEAFHSLTGVNDARNQLGLTGKGIKVAVVDSGVDYMHEALGGGFGPGKKVAFGYDFVGDQYSRADNTQRPDSDPRDNCSEESHGTHVAGIIAADARNLTNPAYISQVPFTGVAPGVTLGAYRVFGCPSDNTGTDVITNAIYRAAADGADIINLSIGGGPAYSDGSDAAAATKVGLQGDPAYVFASHGNDGAAGSYVGGSPGIAAGGFGVAAVDNVEAPQTYLTFGGIDYQYSSGSLNGNWTFGSPYEVVANDINAEATNNFNDGLGTMSPAIKGKVALIRWGDVGFSNKRCTAAANAGAIACILYAYNDNIPNIAGSPNIPSMATSHEAGIAIVNALKAGNLGNKVTINVTSDLKVFKLPTAGTVADFSSPGLDQNLGIKPDIAGIGGAVFSTVSSFSQQANKRKTPYAVYGGTSMSSPYTAGVAALILESFGAKANRPSFEDFRTILQNSATYLKKYNTNLVDSVAYQGAGLVNAYKAATIKTTVSPSRLALNDTTFTRTSYTLTVSNKNTVSVTYNVQHQPALLLSPFKAGDDASQVAATQGYTADYATVKFGASTTDKSDTLSLTVPAGTTKSFTVYVQPPSTANPALTPIYSGYVVLTNTDGEKLVSVPYAGVVGSWREAKVWSRKSASFDQNLVQAADALGKLGITVPSTPSLSTGVYHVQDFTPVVSSETVSLRNAGLILAPIAATTTKYARIEVIYNGRSWTRLNNAGIPTGSTMIVSADSSFSLNPKTDGTIEVSGGGPLAFPVLQRASYVQGQGIAKANVFYWTGKVVTGTSGTGTARTLPSGTGPYQIKFAALKHFGTGAVNPATSSDYDIVLSPNFYI
ncbi:hypothetical protein HDU97_004438 [Phlyctochytrium planicorne]|nr:hypothetical protein HDU97_004438 [Phlyctochytrium planicorne]